MSVNNISVRAFEGCKDLFIIKVDAKNEVYASYQSNGIIEKASNALVLGTADTVLDSSLSTVKQFAFYGSAIKSITVPASMTSLEPGAFAGCKELMEITVDDANPIYSDNDINAVVEKENSRIVVGCKGTKINKSIKIIGQRAYEGSGVFYIHLDLIHLHI